MRYVIIGNSAAGIGAVEGIRQVDKEGEIVIISREPYHTYSRPLISYLIYGKTDREKMKYRVDGFYEDMGCAFMGGKAVTQILPDKKEVGLDDGSKIAYDKLFVGTGSDPFVPPIEGLNTVNDKFTFMSLDDAVSLEKALSPEKRVLIMGAGLIGLKCAEAILHKVKSIVVADLAPRVLSSILDGEGAGMIQKHLENKGIEFRLSAGVNKFATDKAYLSTGEEVGFDILVIAAGVRPNTALLKGIADVERGIIINEKSETSAKDIYAAGDCTQTKDISSGQNKIMALLPNAYMQGECAGINMAGGEATFDKAIPMNAIGFLGLHIITAGNYVGEVYKGDIKDGYKRLFYSDNKLNGYILIGDVQKAGIYTSLIRERTPLDTIDFGLICERPGLMAFTKETRCQKLGGIKA